MKAMREDAQLVGPDGEPVSSRRLVRCPQCGEGADKREVVTFFGGHWKRVCLCGHVYDKGRGVAPVED